MKQKTKTVKKGQKQSHKKTPAHSKHFARVYWPYIPIVGLLLFGIFFSGVHTGLRDSASPSTLAYATEMSVNGLLAATNAERASNGLPPLTVNTKLNQSAQAKANDMKARDYWAHNTPDGQEPWIFFDAAGYEYQKAGENLAYGFSNSETTVIGWMNSPSHRANILDDSYTEVGFGFTNAENFVQTGQETVVVAHYAKPLIAVASPTPVAQQPAVQSQVTQVQSQAVPSSAGSAVEQVADQPAEPTVVEDTVVAEENAAEKDLQNLPVTSETPVQDKNPTAITRIQRLTGGSAPWSAVVVTTIAFLVVLVWLAKHALLVKRFIVQGEHFVAHHPVFDLLVISVAALAVYLSQTSGIVL